MLVGLLPQRFERLARCRRQRNGAQRECAMPVLTGIQIDQPG